MTLERAADILRANKFKATKPANRKQLPQYMQDWSDEKIDKYFDGQKDWREALDLAIRSLNIMKQFKSASYDLVDIFDNIDKGEQ